MKYIIKITDRARQIIEGLSFRQLINQVCCPMFPKEREKSIDEFGAMFFHAYEREYLIENIKAFKELCKIPPFIVSDLECGAGRMVLGATKFSSMMALSQTNSVELAYKTGKIAAEEAGEIGYNWTFAPVADLAFDKDNPVVSTRSAGKEPEHVIKMVGAYMRGLQENGMMATIKHFPGDGYGSYDQHLTTPENPLDMDSWWKYSGRVFKELIEEGAMAVMPGHISLPAYDEINVELNMYPPATLSKRILLDLLRGELGFEGLIVSDAINMGGAVGFMNYYDACAAALENGCDCLLFPKIDENFYIEMENQIKAGKLTIQTLKDRAARIVAMKEQIGLLDGSFEKNIITVDKEINKKVSDSVVENSITVVRDRKGIIPFNIYKDTKVLYLVIMNNHDRYTEMYEGMKNELKRFSDNITFMVHPGPDALFAAVYKKEFDLVICSIGSRLSYGLNVVRLHDEIARNMMGGWTKLGTPVIFVSHFHPFIHKEYEASIDTIINTYDNTDYTPKCIVEGITGSRVLKREVFVQD